MGEQAAVEAQNLAHHAEHLAAVVHLAPQVLDAAWERRRVGKPQLFERLGEQALGQQAHVLGEHGEQAAHEKLRDQLLIEAVVFQLLGQGSQVRRHLARDLGRVLGWIEGQWLLEHAAERVGVLGQIAQKDPVGLGVGERAIVPGSVKGGVQVEAMADVADDDERFRPVEAACVPERLAEGILHQDVPGRRPPLGLAQLAGAFARCLLGLQDEAALLVQVNVASGHITALVCERGRSLEDIGVLLRVARRRIRRCHAQHAAQLGQEHVLVGPLGRTRAGPLVDEGVEVLAHARKHRNPSHEPRGSAAQAGKHHLRALRRHYVKK